MSWHDAKKTLKRDVRWEVVAASVESTERETVFQSHIRAMNEKKRSAFRKLLDETLQVCYKTSPNILLNVFESLVEAQNVYIVSYRYIRIYKLNTPLNSLIVWLLQYFAMSHSR